MMSMPSPISPRTSATCVSRSSRLSNANIWNSPNSVGSLAVGDALHEPLVLHPVPDQIGDRDERQAVPLREPREIGHARHRAVAIHDLADDAGRRQAGQPRQIDGGFGMSGAHQHAAVARAQRKDVSGPEQILRPGGRIDRRLHRRRAIGRRDAGARLALSRRSTRTWPSRARTSSPGRSAESRARPAARASSPGRPGRGRASP